MARGTGDTMQIRPTHFAPLRSRPAPVQATGEGAAAAPDAQPSPAQGTAAARRYVPRSLPLRGPDYSIAVQRGNPLQDVSVEKHGEAIRIAHRTNPAQSALVQVGADGIAIQRAGRPSTFLRQSGNQISIVRPNGGGPNLTITHLGDRIAVNRQNDAGDVIFARSQDQFAIDRYGVQNDVLITTSPDRTVIDHFQNHQDTVISTAPGMPLDPVTWQDELSLDPQAWEILNKWFDDGRVSTDDLVTVTESGQVLEWDGLLQ
ncbi:MAG: hypothetical protein HY319_00575 [Armatimonadetes bacterium]|nr:hypothetical protein [Armatimonadota bacterium]